MPQTSYFKVTSGLFFSILSTFECNRALKRKELDTFIFSVGAVPGRWAHQGSWVTGLYFGGSKKIKGWREMGKTLPGYYRPDTRNVLGKKYKELLKGLVLLTGEDLAKALQLPPFFNDGGDFCTSVESSMIGGVYYLQVPSVLSHKFKVIGVQEITRTEHEQALALSKAAMS